MIVYSFQNPSILRQIEKEHQIRCDPKYWDEELSKYYEWMYQQYKERIGSPIKSLVWGWEKIPNWYFEIDKERDEWDEQRDEAYRYRLLFTLEIPDERILWSCYDGWHAPLNDIQILTEEEEREAENGRLFKETHGWERVFDFEWLLENEWSGETIKQGVFDVVDISVIKEIKYYDAKKKVIIKEEAYRARLT